MPRRNNNRQPRQNPESRPPVSESDRRILAAPTPLGLAQTPGSETISVAAQAAFNAMQTDLEAYVEHKKRDHEHGNSSGNPHISNGGPGIDTLNLLDRLAFRKINPNSRTPYQPAETPSATMAQRILTAYPNPKDIRALAHQETEHILRLTQRQGYSVDGDTERNTIDQALSTIYGERFTELRNQEDEQHAQQLQRQAEQQQREQEAQAQQAEQAQQTAEAERLANDARYEGREVIAKDHATQLYIKRIIATKMNSIDETLTEGRNTISTLKNRLLRFRTEKASAKMKRKQAKLDTSLFKFVNNRRAKSAAKAARKYGELNNTYTKHTAMMKARVERSDERSVDRLHSIHEKIIEWSEKAIKAREKKLRRRLLNEREVEGRNEGMSAFEARLWARRSITDKDRRVIRAAAVREAKLAALTKGYNQDNDFDRESAAPHSLAA